MIEWDFDTKYAKDFTAGELWTLEELAEYERQQEEETKRTLLRTADIRNAEDYIVWKKKAVYAMSNI